MFDPFTLKLILSFLIGGVWITVVTLIAEKYGSKLGGILLAVPSTMLISLVFIAWTLSTKAAVEATSIMPLTLSLSGLFAIIYVIFSKYNFWIGLVTATSITTAINLYFAHIKLNNFLLGIICFFVLVYSSYYVLTKAFKVHSIKGKHIKHRTKDLALRFLFSGSIIVLSIYLSKIGGPLLGGVFAAFPAVGISSLIICYYVKGIEFTNSIQETWLLGGLSCLIYIIIVRFTYLDFGVLIGTVLAFIGSTLTSYTMYHFFGKKIA